MPYDDSHDNGLNFQDQPLNLPENAEPHVFALGLQNGVAALIASSSLTAKGKVSHSASSQLVANSTIVAKGKVSHSASSQLVANSTIVASGGTSHSAISHLVAVAAMPANGTAIYSASSPLTAKATSTAKANVLHDATAVLVGRATFSAAGIDVVPAKATLVASSVISPTGTRIQTVSITGGSVVGGAAVVTQPIYYYTPAVSATYINFEGHSPAGQQWSYTPDSTISIGGKAPIGVGYNYVAQGDISIGGAASTPNLSLTVGYGMYWRLNQAATALFGFTWNVGTQRQYWYRVIGQPRIDPCNPDCCRQLVMTIQAPSVSNVCSQIQSQYGVWPLQSIQQFLKPAETAAVAEDAANGITYPCNTLIDQTFCNIPICAEFCVEYSAQEYWGFTDSVEIIPAMSFVQALSLPKMQHNATGSIKFGGKASSKLSVKAPKANTKIKFGGSAPVKSTAYSHKGSGSFSLTGVAKIKSTRWRYEPSWKKNVEVTAFDITQTGYGTPWEIDEFCVNNLNDGHTSYFTLSNLEFNAPLGAKLSGVIITFQRCANGLVRDAEVVTMSRGRVLRHLAKSYDWPLAIPTTVQYGDDNNDLGFVPGEPFEFRVSLKPKMVREGLVAQISKPKITLVYDIGGRVNIGGTATVRTNFWKHNEVVGQIAFGGSARCRLITKKKKPKPEVPRYPIVFESNIQSQGLSRTKMQGDFIVRALGTGTISTNITSIPQAVVPTLSPPTNTINTCLCTGMPLTLDFSHNLGSSNKLEQFIQRNGLTFNNYLNIEYNTINNSWQNNIQLLGASSSAANAEAWVMVFELQCTNLLGGTQIGVNVWRFAIKISQRNVLTNEILQTRLMVAFLPNQLCANGQDFRFVLTFDTQMGLATISPSSTIYEVVFYDAIGMFKTADWVSSPNLVINMTQITSPTPTYPIFIGSNS